MGSETNPNNQTPTGTTQGNTEAGTAAGNETQTQTETTPAPEGTSEGTQATPEGDPKPTETKSTETEVKDPQQAALDALEAGEEESPESNAPEEYADFTSPEGMGMNEDVLGTFSEQARADGLSQETAQKYVDMAMAMIQDHQSSEDAAHQTELQKWNDEAAAHKDAKANNMLEARGIKAMGLEPKAQGEFLNSFVSKMPMVRRLLQTLGKANSEPPVHEGAGEGQAEQSLADRMYKQD